MKSDCCVIIGGYVNAYSIIQELNNKKVKDIILIDYYKDIAYYSNKITARYLIGKSSSSLRDILLTLREQFEKLILFPTQDIHLNHICEIHNEIIDFSFIAFNPITIQKYENKFEQYEICKKLNIPYPKTEYITKKSDVDKCVNLIFPIIIKPTTRDNLSIELFRNLILNNEKDFNKYKQKINLLLEKNYSFIASEIIPGDGSNIYAYVSYRSSKGEILGEWTGKKLAQFPNDFGVFSSAKAEHNQIVADYGKKIINEMNLWGINEPEFKYDCRDNKYKLMEVNLRPMMWHRVGELNGISLNYTQYLYAVEDFITPAKNTHYSDIHYVNLVYEVINLFTRRGYFRLFVSNVFHNKIDVAGFDRTDIKPFFYLFIVVFRKFFHKTKRDKI